MFSRSPRASSPPRAPWEPDPQLAANSFTPGTVYDGLQFDSSIIYPVGQSNGAYMRGSYTAPLPAATGVFAQTYDPAMQSGSLYMNRAEGAGLAAAWHTPQTCDPELQDNPYMRRPDFEQFPAAARNVPQTYGSRLQTLYTRVPNAAQVPWGIGNILPPGQSYESSYNWPENKDERAVRDSTDP
jgi:hypothetical protein